MALPLTEDFEGGSHAQELDAYDSAWVQLGSALDIQNWNSELAVGRDTAGDPEDYGKHYWSTDTPNNDQYAEQIISLQSSFSSTSDSFTGVGVRADTGDNDGYYFGVRSNYRAIFLVENSGEFSVLGSATGNQSDGTRLSIEANGTDLKPYIDGASDTGLGDQTDSTHASGRIAIYMNFVTGIHPLDEVRGGNGSPPGGATTAVKDMVSRGVIAFSR